VIAAAASAAAAVVVSHLWKDGTVIAAAMTPVIVAIVKELLQRPMESEIVRKPVQKVSGIASSRLPVSGSRTATRGTGDPVLPPTERQDYGDGDGAPPAEGRLTPMRTYGGARRRPLHLKVAIVTGLIAFLIAAAALTLPELLFGGAISSHHDTTLFGGGSKSGKKKNQNNGPSTQPNQSKPKQQHQATTPATPPPTSGSKPPPRTTPSQTSPQPSPHQTTPQQTTPVPTTPTPSKP
jgi:hypothetical protein